MGRPELGLGLLGGPEPVSGESKLLSPARIRANERASNGCFVHFSNSWKTSWKWLFEDKPTVVNVCEKEYYF